MEQWRGRGLLLQICHAPPGSTGPLPSPPTFPPPHRPSPRPRKALFHSLLTHPHWAVRGAALGSLVLYSRTSACHGTFLGLVPPACMAGPGAAAPAFVAVFKAFMARAPDEEVRRAPHGPARGRAARRRPSTGQGASVDTSQGMQPRPCFNLSAEAVR
jgi:hypothetical protein